MRSLPIARDEAASPLPPLYAKWVEEMLATPLPREPHATCSSCVMLAPAETNAPEGSLFFDPSTKCCTLPNFRAGGVLADLALDPTHARDVIAARIAARASVTPLGLDAPTATRERYVAASKAGRFGRAPDLLCPHYRAGPNDNCGIWRHRNATCATWYCKHERGERGALFWKRLRDQLALVEARLARWCALDLGVEDAALARLITSTNVEGERIIDAERDTPRWYRAVWGRWVDREIEFYEACAARVAPLAWADVERICGFDATVGARLVNHAARAREDRTMPRALRLGAIEASPPDANGMTVVRGYSDYDPLTLPAELLAAIARFDGRRSTDDVLSDLEAEGVALDRELVGTLADYEILVAADLGATA